MGSRETSEPWKLGGEQDMNSSSSGGDGKGP